MIYLIEDKASRRIDYGWSDEKIASSSNVITLIDNIEGVRSLSCLETNDVVLFHESFYNTADYESKKTADIFKVELEYNSDSLHIAFFSGSKNLRTLDGNVCNIPPYVMYENLESFILHYKQGELDFRYLMFGENYEIEDKLRSAIDRINVADVGREKVQTNKNILFCTTSDDWTVQCPFDDVTPFNTIDYDCSDKDFISFIQNNLGGQKYDAIFLPQCFGETYSDYLGLRLALLIKLCDTPNKFTPICIYGQAPIQEMVGNECFDVIKFSSVSAISCDFDSFISTLDSLHDETCTQYLSGLNRLHLDVPTDIGDNHSITNKWGICRWSYAINDSDDYIEQTRYKVENTLYFKYLMAMCPSKEIKPVNRIELKINKDVTQPDLNVLYVDDEADDGWYELMCEILYTENNVGYDYLGQDLKHKSQKEIINMVMDKVKVNKSNVVILDFRLHPTDFTAKAIVDVTGYKILKEIKKLNRGIQVLVFSATNKIWNLQALQSAGADGFLMKEAPVNSIDPTFSRNSIKKLISILGNFSHRIYRMLIWEKMQQQKEYLHHLKKNHLAGREYCVAVENLLTMTEDSMFSDDMKYPHATSFLNLFRIIEATANEWIDDEPVETEKDGRIRYYFKFRNDDMPLLNFPKKKFTNQKVGTLYLDNTNLPYVQKILNILHRVGAYSEATFNVVAKRNDFIHPNLVKKDRLASFEIKDVIDAFDIVNKLITKQS